MAKGEVAISKTVNTAACRYIIHTYTHTYQPNLGITYTKLWGESVVGGD